MSDLQCAATLLLVPDGQVEDFARSLAGARIGHVWTGTSDRATGSGELLATDLGVGVTARSELDDPQQIDLALGEIADEHRGETVVVVVPGGAVTEIVIDSDGWRRQAWGADQG
ncbi:hypothetical protein [Nocardioides bizhenqiangii]|uniref:VOC domain-containing protein n=1 Tax=Nocardioides bizhenqiangii TaxID=3095076 RepID=A0ABZ0ZLD2_9ACTN|nr:hypothetical protein [Nocardioides sp. HM61]WQQ25134.1 hypothetical protein SHK19_14305 [Nocardioides sp. HM61]